MENQTGNMQSQEVPPYNFEHSKNLKNKILKPIRQEKIVKVPVTKYVEKLIEKEEVRYVNKYVDVIKPIITYKTKHISKPIYLDKIKYEPKVIEKEKIIHIPKIEYRNKIVEIPVYVHKQNIIEKKVPLIIERVIPVLKVKKIEKEVLTDSVELPIICTMKNESRVMINKVEESENHNEVTQYNHQNCEEQEEITNENYEIYNKETFNNQESTKEYSNVFANSNESKSEMERNYKIKNINDEKSLSIHNEESFNCNINEKHNTMYNDETNEDGLNENEKRSMIEEKIDSYYNSNDITEENYYNVNDRFKNSNLSHVSIHLPLSKNIVKNSSENYCSKISSNNLYDNGMNNLMTNSQNMNFSNNQVFNDAAYMNEMINQQIKKDSVCEAKRNIMAKSFDANMPPHFYNNFSNSVDMEQKKIQTLPNMKISYDNYNLSHSGSNYKNNVFTNNFIPSYANSNGQAFMSVRPATILEYTPKPRKNKTSICNFMSKCCGKQN